MNVYEVGERVRVIDNLPPTGFANRSLYEGTILTIEKVHKKRNDTYRYDVEENVWEWKEEWLEHLEEPMYYEDIKPGHRFWLKSSVFSPMLTNNDAIGEVTQIEDSSGRLRFRFKVLSPEQYAGQGQILVRAPDLIIKHEDLIYTGFTKTPTKPEPTPEPDYYRDTLKEVLKYLDEQDPDYAYDLDRPETFRFLGITFDVQAAKAHLKAKPRDSVEMPLNKDLINFMNLIRIPDVEQEIDLMVPVIVAELGPGNGALVIDGWHRIKKAHELGHKAVLAQVLNVRETEQISNYTEPEPDGRRFQPLCIVCGDPVTGHGGMNRILCGNPECKEIRERMKRRASRGYPY